MARVLVTFDIDRTPILTGDVPPDSHTPIENPIWSGFVTGVPFIVAPGVYCYGLQSRGVAYTPLWQVVQAVDGELTEIAFHRTVP